MTVCRTDRGHEDATLARRLQTRLEGFYRLEALPDVDDFAEPTDEEGREVVLVRQAPDAVEVSVTLPAAGLVPPSGDLSLDVLCQIVEGVSHFVYLADRIRSLRSTTRLELELQAEVDKFVVLGFAAVSRADHGTAWRVVHRLYEGVRFLHPAGSEEGDRYRVANDLAARFCARVARRVGSDARERLVRFHREGQEEKMRLARAA